jgi:hypothetical protein
MIGVTFFGIFLTPVFFYVISSMGDGGKVKPAAAGADVGKELPEVEPAPARETGEKTPSAAITAESPATRPAERSPVGEAGQT